MENVAWAVPSQHFFCPACKKKTSQFFAEALGLAAPSPGSTRRDALLAARHPRVASKLDEQPHGRRAGSIACRIKKCCFWYHPTDWRGGILTKPGLSSQDLGGGVREGWAEPQTRLSAPSAPSAKGHKRPLRPPLSSPGSPLPKVPKKKKKH